MHHWLTRQRLILYSCAFLSVYLFLALYLPLTLKHGADPQGNPLGCDFVVFWSASHLGLSGHAAEAYDAQRLFDVERHLALPLVDFKAQSTWQYPPGFLLLVLPLALLPYFPSLLLYLAGTLAVYAAVVRRILPRPGSVLPVLAAPAVFINAGGGQNGFITTALISAALLLLETRPAWAGLLIGLLSIKPQLGLLLPLALLCGRHWRALLFAVFGTIAWQGLSLAVLGSDTLPAFLSRLPVVAGWLADGLMPMKKMPTVYALLRLLGAPASAAYAAHGAVALSAAAAVAWIWWARLDRSLRYAALLVGTLLVSPYLYDYDLVWLAPALMWLAEYGLRRGWRRGEREVMVAAWLMPGLVVVLYALLHVQLAVLVLLALFGVILRRAVEERQAGTAALPAAGTG
ncbi:MAG: DUF2029 domain-containing protein [Nevskia sp.]|nr:DUF2029 domain-containing protein [Nevskia sp.]